MKRQTLSIAIISLLTWWTLPGCLNPSSGDSVDNGLVTREETVDFDDPYGGYNLGDESEAFGDATMVDDFGPATVAGYDDPMADDPIITDANRNHKTRRYLMITWGNLERDSLVTSSTDWSGSLCVENGAVLLRRTIRFEDNDKILPRVSRDKLEWASHTRPHFDGILVGLHRMCKRDTTGDSTIVECDTISVSFKPAR